MTPATVLLLEEIPASDGLDSIQVYWRDVGEGQGHVTITCWGCAWTCYFGGMSGKTTRQFFGAVSVDYMAGKLGNAQHLQQRRRDVAYLERIVSAIRKKILSEVAE